MNATSHGRENQQIRLPDGRMLGFAEFGSTRGYPVFYFHGFPGSRLEAHLAHRLARTMKIRVIAVDRPGFGLSDFKADRTIVDWPSDCAHLADALGVQTFSVMGISGGGPYAAACAHQLSRRINATAIVCGLGTIDVPAAMEGMFWIDRYALSIFRHAVWLIRPFCNVVAWGIRRNAESLFVNFKPGVPESDRAILALPRIRELVSRSFKEAIRKGTEGCQRELRLISSCWGFKVQDILAPVHLFHGESDCIVPCNMSRRLSQLLPNCTARFYPGEGHYSLPVNHLPEILKVLK